MKVVSLYNSTNIHFIQTLFQKNISFFDKLCARPCSILQIHLRLCVQYTEYGKEGFPIARRTREKDIFAGEIAMLHKRSKAAFAEQDDDLLIKIVGALCKVAESQAKLGVREHDAVEVVLKGDPAANPEALQDLP